MASIRINKFIAERLGLSRRESDEYIAAGRVRIDGQLARLGQAVSTASRIIVDGKAVPFAVNYQYICLHKPVGYVCSRRRQGDSPTIYELLPAELHELKPVGRLDRGSSGLLLLTNDGDFAHRMTHPSFHKQKTYLVSLDHDLTPLHQQMISDHGIVLEDGPSKLTLERQSNTSRTDWVVLMHEGRNRQIRRTFAALDYTVTALHRTVFGNYALGDIPPGEHRFVDMR